MDILRYTTMNKESACVMICIVSKNFAKALDLKCKFDVAVWRHKQRTHATDRLRYEENKSKLLWFQVACGCCHGRCVTLPDFNLYSYSKSTQKSFTSPCRSCRFGNQF